MENLTQTWLHSPSPVLGDQWAIERFMVPKQDKSNEKTPRETEGSVSLVCVGVGRGRKVEPRMAEEQGGMFSYSALSSTLQCPKLGNNSNPSNWVFCNRNTIFLL